MSNKRASGRVELARGNHLTRGGNRGKFANDSPTRKRATDQAATKRRYITAKRVAAVQAALSTRDRAILSDVARINVATGSQLQRLHYESSPAGQRLTRSDLARLTAIDVLARLGRSIGGVRAGSAGFCYSLGIAGQRLAYPERKRYRRPWSPQPQQLNHALAVSELYVQLCQTTTRAGTRLSRFDAEPAAWRRFPASSGGRTTLKPDAFVVIEGDDYEDRLFIELDRATESLPRIAEKAKAYIRYWQSGREQAAEGVFPQVLFVVPGSHRAALVVSELSRLPAEHWRLFAVVSAERAVERILAGDFSERTWTVNRKEVS